MAVAAICMIIQGFASTSSASLPRPDLKRALVSDLENKTFDAEKGWIGQALSYYVRETLKHTGQLEVLPHRSIGINLFDGDLDYYLSGEYKEDQESFVITAMFETRYPTPEKKYFLTEGGREHVLRLAQYLTTQITLELGVTLSSQELSGRVWGATSSIDAYENFIRAISERRLREKIRLYRAAITLDKSFGAAHEHLGLVMVYAGRWDEAETVLKRATEIMPGDADIFNNLGYVYDRRGKSESAEEAFRQAVQLAPQSLKFKLNLADLISNRGRHGEALRIYKEVLEQDKDSREARDAIAALTTVSAGAPQNQPYPSPIPQEIPVEPPPAVEEITVPPERESDREAVREPAREPVREPVQEPVRERPVEPSRKPAPKVPDAMPSVAPEEGWETDKNLIQSLQAKGNNLEARRALIKASKRFSGNKEIKELLKQDKKIWVELDPALEEFDGAGASDRDRLTGLLEGAFQAFAGENWGQGYYNLGLFYKDREQFYSAYANLRRAVKEDPGNSDAQYQLAEVCTALNRTKEAQKHKKLSGRQ
ncbi:tetratricopeptide repeat protein [Acidobacteriota bacterium]